MVLLRSVQFVGGGICDRVQPLGWIFYVQRADLWIPIFQKNLLKTLEIQKKKE